MRAQTATPKRNKLFKHSMAPEVAASISARVAAELQQSARRDKFHLIPEAAKLTLILNEKKNRIRLGSDDYSDRFQYLTSAGLLAGLLNEMGVPLTQSASGNFAADLCAAAQNYMAFCLGRADREEMPWC